MSQQFKILTSCDAPGCASLSTQEFAVRVGDRLPESANRYVMLPDDWQQVGEKTFCERHKVVVTVTVDGTLVE